MLDFYFDALAQLLQCCTVYNNFFGTQKKKFMLISICGGDILVRTKASVKLLFKRKLSLAFRAKRLNLMLCQVRVNAS